jgi:predicted DNA-binding transcriptional regulator AlpA
VPEYLDVKAVADLLGVKPQTVRAYKHRGDAGFPEPDLVITGHPAWRRETIEAWIARRPGQGIGGGRPKGRRKGTEREQTSAK